MLSLFDEKKIYQLSVLIWRTIDLKIWSLARWQKWGISPVFKLCVIWVALQTLSQIPLGNLLHQQLFFVRSSFNRRVEASVVAMGKLLYEVKGGGQGVAISKSEINAAADAILEPLMDLLEGSLTTYAKICDKSVLKRLLKELWKIVIRSLEKNIVLPPAQDKSVRISRLARKKPEFPSDEFFFRLLSKALSRTVPAFWKSPKKWKMSRDFSRESSVESRTSRTSWVLSR